MGTYPAKLLSYAGGVPVVMQEVRDLLHLDSVAVTGTTVGENLDGLEGAGLVLRDARLRAQH